MPGMSIANPNFFETVFFVGYLHKVRILELIFQAIDESLFFGCMDTLVVSLVCNFRDPNL
jgi:hypothetical protein